MFDAFSRMSYLFLPMLGGAILQGLCLRQGWLQFLAKPIDSNVTIRGRRLFGDHKTFRGVLVFATGTASVMAVQANLLHRFPTYHALETFNYSTVYSWPLGFLLGVSAMLSELPNSFIKRQLDIPAGAAGQGIWLPIFYILDQLDMLLGTWFVWSLVMTVDLEQIIISVVIVFFVHQVVNIIGYSLGMRETPR